MFGNIFISLCSFWFILFLLQSPYVPKAYTSKYITLHQQKLSRKSSPKKNRSEEVRKAKGKLVILIYRSYHSNPPFRENPLETLVFSLLSQLTHIHLNPSGISPWIACVPHKQIIRCIQQDCRYGDGTEFLR